MEEKETAALSSVEIGEDAKGNVYPKPESTEGHRWTA